MTSFCGTITAPIFGGIDVVETPFIPWVNGQALSGDHGEYFRLVVQKTRAGLAHLGDSLRFFAIQMNRSSIFFFPGRFRRA